jgi:glycosyltransferase involved in cell wall biosynthesis
VKVLRIVGGLDPAFGGPSVSSVGSCRATQLAGVRNVLAVPVTDGAALDLSVRMLEDEGVDVRVFPLGKIWPSKCKGWGISPRLARWLMPAANGFDIIHTHGAWTFTTLAGLLAAKRSRRPCVLSPHETLTDFDIAKSPLTMRLLKRFLRRTYLRHFDLVVAASRLEKEDSLVRGMRARVVVVPHAVESARRTGGPLDTQSRPGLRIGFLGRFDSKKNLDVLIRALALLPEDVTLRIAGDGPLELRRSLIELAAQIGVEDRIEWLGFLGPDAKPEFFDSIQILAMPSAYECFGMAAAEAMRAGVAPVVSPRTGIASTLESYGCGYVVEANPTALARLVADVRLREHELAEMGARAADAAEREFGLTAHGKRLRTAYEELLASPLSAAAHDDVRLPAVSER